MCYQSSNRKMSGFFGQILAWAGGFLTVFACVDYVAEPADQPPPVRLLHGFEPEECGASPDPCVLEKRNWRFVGQMWQGGGVASGWRVRDHVEKLLLPEGHDGPVTIYAPDDSRDRPIVHLYRKGATQGRYSQRLGFGEGNWKYVKSYASGNFTGLTAQPGVKGYHEILDWFYQRYGNLFDSALENRYQRLDWSGYEYLRADFLVENAPAVIGIRAFDASGPRIPAHYLGLRTALAVFRLPEGKQVTVDFPLGALARAAELDLSQMMGIVIRIQGYEGEAEIYVDNIRLVTAEAAVADARYPLIKMEGEPGPYARKVIYNPVERDPDKIKRKRGPVERLGPITVYEGTRGYSSNGLLLGGSGATYFQTLRRGCVAYDNDRLLIYFGAYMASASFDGGKTWGGIQPGQSEPVSLGWGGDYRGTASADESDVYFLGTENCSSYHEGYDIAFRRLAMTGPGWTDDRVSLVDQNLRKCPPDMRVWREKSGRIWATISDGWGGVTAKYSDDDGYTWAPCKDASLPPPRPFYQPDLAVLSKPASERSRPPAAILPWPGTPVCGPVLLPWQGHIAVFGGKEWQVHDGQAWGTPQKLPLGVPGRGSATVLGDRIFIAHGAPYHDLNRSCTPSSLVVAEYDGTQWKQLALEQEGVGDSIISASGQTVFLFFVKYTGGDNRNEIRMRRWKNGNWSESELVAEEPLRINRLAAPIISAPDYAAVWWDTVGGRGEKRVLRFAKLPNP
ncbi:MAG: hypothetical protein ACUVWX_06830 [Kiritimatiellia bacterium]